MKIYVLGTRGFPKIQGGVEKHCESLYPLFSEEFKFIVFRRKPYLDSSAKRQVYPNIRFIDLPSTKIKGFEAVFHSFMASVLSCLSDCSIVHIHNIGPALFSPILHFSGKKIVLTYHSPNYEHAKWGKLAKRLLKYCEHIALKYADAIIFVNKFQMKKYPPKIRKKSYYIPNGVPSIVFTSTTNYIDSLELKPRQYIISVGRISQEKGFDILIKAFENIDTEFKLVIVGGVETESAYLQKIKKLVWTNRVVFTGYIYGEKLHEVYSHAAIYVLSSLSEGFPLALLEAMKYRLDVLVSDIPASHLVNLEAQDYFIVGDLQDLTAKLRNKINDFKKRDYNLSEYNWIYITKQVAAIYRNL